MDRFQTDECKGFMQLIFLIYQLSAAHDVILLTIHFSFLLLFDLIWKILSRFVFLFSQEYVTILVHSVANKRLLVSQRLRPFHLLLDDWQLQHSTILLCPISIELFANHIVLHNEPDVSILYVHTVGDVLVRLLLSAYGHLSAIVGQERQR